MGRRKSKIDPGSDALWRMVDERPTDPQWIIYKEFCQLQKMQEDALNLIISRLGWIMVLLCIWFFVWVSS